MDQELGEEDNNAFVRESIISGPFLPIEDKLEHFETLEIAIELVEYNVPSIEKPHKMEVKQLPSHLQYGYLEVIQTFHVIISTDMYDERSC